MEIDHLGIAVKDLAAALSQWERTSGSAASPPEEVPSQKVRVAFLDVGGTHLEFLEPTQPDSPIARFLLSRGEGMHHVAFGVRSVEQKLHELADQGVRLIDTTSRVGARGRRIGFAHPSAFAGTLVEFVEQVP
ncbi:MAG: methylmalonyl-CoA epimerase [Thermoplasmata archaeon]